MRDFYRVLVLLDVAQVVPPARPAFLNVVYRSAIIFDDDTAAAAGAAFVHDAMSDEDDNGDVDDGTVLPPPRAPEVPYNPDDDVGNFTARPARAAPSRTSARRRKHVSLTEIRRRAAEHLGFVGARDVTTANLEDATPSASDVDEGA